MTQRVETNDEEVTGSKFSAVFFPFEWDVAHLRGYTPILKVFKKVSPPLYTVESLVPIL
jgi:hypothetical protein